MGCNSKAPKLSQRGLYWCADALPDTICPQRAWLDTLCQIKSVSEFRSKKRRPGILHVIGSYHKPQIYVVTNSFLIVRIKGTYRSHKILKLFFSNLPTLGKNLVHNVTYFYCSETQHLERKHDEHHRYLHRKQLNFLKNILMALATVTISACGLFAHSMLPWESC